MIGTKRVRYKGKTYTYPRNYQSEYGERTTVQKHNRVVRRRAREKVIDKYGKKHVQGKDVHHIRGIGGGNGLKNLRVASRSSNRSRK
jgi:hypothetical protein